MQNQSNVAAYIAEFPKDVQEILSRIRTIILEQAPEAVENITYGMPAFKLAGKPLVYFGGFSKHIGFYATPSGHTAFEEELSVYKTGKGSVQFLINKPIPYDLIARMVAFRALENLSTNKTNTRKHRLEK
jgi:uncharacterized protein YdhG (YjbR/CyaY superfamily)